MAIEADKFRIIPDPQVPGKWAFVDNERGQTVSGYASAKAARRGYEREKKRVS